VPRRYPVWETLTAPGWGLRGKLWRIWACGREWDGGWTRAEKARQSAATVSSGSATFSVFT